MSNCSISESSSLLTCMCWRLSFDLADDGRSTLGVCACIQHSIHHVTGAEAGVDHAEAGVDHTSGRG